MSIVCRQGNVKLKIAASLLLAMGCAGSAQDQDQVVSSEPFAITAGTVTGYEAETLARTASAVGSKVTSDAAASGGKYVEFNGTAAAGAFIEFTLPNVAAGTYDLSLLFKSNNNRGIVQASVDGANQGATCDEYAPSAAFKISCSLGRKTLTAGNHTVRFTVASKSASSAGFQMVVDQIATTAVAIATNGPCDVYAAGNTPCVAAYSMVRVLSSAYTGPLYQVRKGAGLQNTGTGGTTQDIGAKNGFGDSAAQDAFCGTDTCTVSKLYDQSGRGNHLKVAPKGTTSGGAFAGMDDFESNATKGALMVGGHRVYSLYMAAREGYRLTAVGSGMPLGTASQGIYMLADGKHYGTQCCWDFGNVSTNPMTYHTMNTLMLGKAYWGSGSGAGPWFMADLEGGVWAGGSGSATTVNPNNPSMALPFAFGVLKTSSGQYAIRAANGQSGSLTTAYDGAAPKILDNQGGIVLGVSSDNSNNSFGTFFEGAITAGRPSDATDAAVLLNVQAAGYGF